MRTGADRGAPLRLDRTLIAFWATMHPDRRTLVRLFVLYAGLEWTYQ